MEFVSTGPMLKLANVLTGRPAYASPNVKPSMIKESNKPSTYENMEKPLSNGKISEHPVYLKRDRSVHESNSENPRDVLKTADLLQPPSSLKTPDPLKTDSATKVDRLKTAGSSDDLTFSREHGSAERIRKSNVDKDDLMPQTNSNLQFSMDNIVRQIRDDIINRCTRIRERVSAMRKDEKEEAGLVPDDYRADLEKRLADLMIVGERSGLSRHKLCVYELECHFHIKIAMVHLEGPTDSMDKAVQLYRTGQYAEALPMLEQQLEKTNCHMHELIAGSMFNLGKIDEAGYHFQQSIKHMRSRPVQNRTVKTDKQQLNLMATAHNAKAKAGESLKNKNYDGAQSFYERANDLYSAIENRREAVEGMILCIGGMNDVILTLMKLKPVEGGSSDAKHALQMTLEMYDKFSDIVQHSELDNGFQNQCQGLCLNILGVAFENMTRYTAAISRYRDSQEAYSKLPDDRQRVQRMRECVIKARHVIRSMTKLLGGPNSEGELPSPVRQALAVVVQMHQAFMVTSDRAKVDPAFRAENQAECMNSLGIGHYELRLFTEAEGMLQRGIEIMKEQFGSNCRHITLAQLLYNLGLLNQDIGQLITARNCFEEARALYSRIEDAETRSEGMRKIQEALEDIE